ncbi:MAG: tRNA 2-thiocytidine(32) synthetase TtcA [Burkholderiales bacterium]|nr:tRNA 2-thiocytidine(32) synthetase TtcA [Burkholderiales bacterium]
MDGSQRTLSRHQAFNSSPIAKRLTRLATKASADYGMIGDGDKVMVCLSGGKDSYTLLDVLLTLQQHAPFRFELVAVNLDQKQPDFPEDVLPRYLRSIGVHYRIEVQDTYSVVKRLIPEGKTMCSLCSRLRRGVLYRVARELGATRIALGHHRDDVLTTLLLNMFFCSKMKAMPPKLVSDDGSNVVIRPLYYCREKDIAAYARIREFPLIPCTLCGSQENMQRKLVKDMLQGWERKHPGRLDNMLRALQNVAPSHLADRAWYDFARLEASGAPQAEGDTAFDTEPLPRTLFEPAVVGAAAEDDSVPG